MKKVKFYFYDDSNIIFNGFTDKSTWNGWNNIFVNDEEFIKILEFWSLINDIDINEQINNIWFINSDDLPYNKDLNLFSLNGFTTLIK